MGTVCGEELKSTTECFDREETCARPGGRIIVVSAERLQGPEAQHLPRSAKNASGVRLDTMKVSYARFEETAQFATRRAFYSREAKQATQRDFPTGVWFDGIGDGSQPGMKRTIDILITRSAPRPTRNMYNRMDMMMGESSPPPSTSPAEGRGNQAEPLVIEILSIEVKDPTAG